MGRLSLLCGALLVTGLAGGCDGDDGGNNNNASDADRCEAYCSTVQTCDATDFDQHFPSLAQCVTNCTYALSGDDPNTQPAACVEATAAVVACVGELSCSQYGGPPCADQHLAQEAACP